MGTGPMEGRHRDGSKGREVVHVGLGRYFRSMMCHIGDRLCARRLTGSADHGTRTTDVGLGMEGPTGDGPAIRFARLRSR